MQGDENGFVTAECREKALIGTIGIAVPQQQTLVGRVNGQPPEPQECHSGEPDEDERDEDRPARQVGGKKFHSEA